MKNRKGFTLIEILAVIAILSILISAASISVIEIRKKMNNRLYNTKISLIESAAILWGEDNEYELSLEENECENILVDDLVTEGYLKYDKDNKVINPKDDSSMNNGIITVCLLENNTIEANFLE